MDGSSTLIRTSQIVGITASTLLAGSAFTMSLITVPLIRKSPTLILLQQWRTLFTTGSKIAPPFAIFTFVNFGYLAYISRSDQGQTDSSPSSWQGYGFAAIAVVAIVPFTLLFMNGVNDQLMAASGEGVGKAVLSAADVTGLVKRWGMLNSIRSVLPLLGAVIGLWTSLN